MGIKIGISRIIFYQSLVIHANPSPTAAGACMRAIENYYHNSIRREKTGIFQSSPDS